MNLVVAMSWQGYLKPPIATPRSHQLLAMNANWVWIHDFQEQVNPDIKGGEPIEVVVCSPEVRRGS